MYVRKSRFTALLARRRKTKFPTVYPPQMKILNTIIPLTYGIGIAEYLHLQIYPWNSLPSV